MKAIFKREFKSFFNGMLGYIFCAFILLFAGIFTMIINLKALSARFEDVIASMWLIFLIAVPILTMRTFAEERKQKTDILLYSLPVSMAEVVLGKFLALICVFLIPIAIIGIYPLILSVFGNVNLFASYGTLFAFFMLGASLISMGMLVSSLTDNQVVAVVASFVLVLLNYFIATLSDYVSHNATATFVAFAVIIIAITLLLDYLTKNSVFSLIIGALGIVLLTVFKMNSPELLSGLFPKIMNTVSVFERFYIFPDGVFDISALVYFVTVTVVFLFFTVQVLEKRRWN